MQSIWHCSISPPSRAAASEFILDRPFLGFEGRCARSEQWVPTALVAAAEQQFWGTNWRIFKIWMRLIVY
jgi:hypothetical protein